MDACRWPSRTRPLAATDDPEHDVDRDWFALGALCFKAPLDPRHLPPLGHLRLQLAWLIGFATAWFGGWSGGKEPVDDDVTLYTGITATLRNHQALLLETWRSPRSAKAADLIEIGRPGDSTALANQFPENPRRYGSGCIVNPSTALRPIAGRVMAKTRHSQPSIVAYFIPREFLRIVRADPTGFVHRFCGCLRSSWSRVVSGDPNGSNRP